jgi:hypothetical protein
MAFEIDNYGRLVLEDYYQKRAAGSLGPGLMQLTPAGLRDECLQAYRDRFLEKDENAIKGFFVAGNKPKTLSEIIEQYDLGKFKVIINYLNSGGTIKTKGKNVFMLAWLIDFKDRPYEYGKKYGPALAEVLARKGRLTQRAYPATDNDKGDSVPTATGDITIEKLDEEGDELVTAVPEETAMAGSLVKIAVPKIFAGKRTEFKRDKSEFSIRQTLMVSALLLSLGISGYWIWERKDVTKEKLGAGNADCMYWADDHFQPISCNQKISNTIVLPLDSVKIRSFKKITRPDTITNNAKGYVWYSKINKEIEFFTADGEHPVDTGRRLHPITDYMINKYIVPERAERSVVTATLTSIALCTTIFVMILVLYYIHASSRKMINSDKYV